MTTPARPNSGRLFWPGLIVGLVVMQIALCVLALVLALRAPGGQVVPDYYRKGIEWDERENPKSETRNPNQIPNLKSQTGHRDPTRCLGHWDLGLPSGFGFRISGFTLDLTRCIA
jgi:hypothetical protein